MKNEEHSIQSRIQAFISEKGLEEGDSLPSDEVFASTWNCSTEAVADAMKTAEQNGRIRRQADGSVIVLSAPILHEPEEFSFTRSAHLLHQTVRTEVINHELKVRLPLTDNPLEQMEKTAQAALGLKAHEPFIVIPRIRYLQDKPRVLHRVYLNPRRFKPTFLHDHDFANESLVEIYESSGYKLTSRDTTITARLPNLIEVNDLAIPLEQTLSTPLLVAEQCLIALDPETKTPFTLEFLQGTYLYWQYRIEDRPPPRASRRS